jgi:hypothetical protein
VPFEGTPRTIPFDPNAAAVLILNARIEHAARLTLISSDGENVVPVDLKLRMGEGPNRFPGTKIYG